MIAKRINRTTNDSFRRLADYIAGAKDPGEKLDRLWTVNTAGGTLDDLDDGLDMAITGIEATQALNTRVKVDKSYHLVVSFRDQQPSPQALLDIERTFAEALGFGEHQRIAATHHNTDNFHLHMAVNKIHPATLKAHTPHRDFRTLEKVCRVLEQKHDLKIDPGRQDKTEADRKPEAARDMEAHTWEESLFGYAHGHKATTWQDLHEAFGKYDLKLRKRGNGLVIGTADGKHHIKASALDRSFSKAALEKRLGPFTAPKMARTAPKPLKRYITRPITRHRGQKALWQRYTATRKRKTAPSFKTWRDFLMYAAINDPLAIAIIQAQKKMLAALTGQNLHLAPSARPATPPAPAPGKHTVAGSTDRHDHQAQPPHSEVDKATADRIGAFRETALTAREATRSNEHLNREGRYTPPKGRTPKTGKPEIDL